MQVLPRASAKPTHAARTPAFAAPTILAILSILAILAISAPPSRAQTTTPPPAPVANAASPAADIGPCVVDPHEIPPSVTFKLRATCLTQTTFSLGSIISPAFGAAYEMAFPPDHFPREWKDGPEAFGRNYGDRIARRTASGLTKFTIAAIDREDPRYYASKSTNVGVRALHAIVFSVFDKTDSGHTTIALSNLAGASAGGFVGMTYLPSRAYFRATPRYIAYSLHPGYNDEVHGYQHAATEMITFASSNLIAEFYPELSKAAHKLHIPVPRP